MLWGPREEPGNLDSGDSQDEQSFEACDHLEQEQKEIPGAIYTEGQQKQWLTAQDRGVVLLGFESSFWTLGKHLVLSL